MRWPEPTLEASRLGPWISYQIWFQWCTHQEILFLFYQTPYHYPENNLSPFLHNIPSIPKEHSISFTSNGACLPHPKPPVNSLFPAVMKHLEKASSTQPVLFFSAEWIPPTAKCIVVDEAFLVKAGFLWEATTSQLPQTYGISFSPAPNS